MRNSLDERLLKNLSLLDRIPYHLKTYSAIKPLSSDQRDAILKFVKFIIYLKTDNLEGDFKFPFLAEVNNFLNECLSLLEKLKQGCVATQPTSIQDMNLLKALEDASISHSEIENLHRDEFDDVIRIAMFLQGKQVNNLDQIEETIILWSYRSQSIQ